MGGPSPCGSCKLRRRRCTTGCIFAPYFPFDDPQKFVVIHKVFGASKVRKMLQELPDDQRAAAMRSLVYEANAREEDPVCGCAGVISLLQSQVSELEAARNLYDMSQAQIPRIQNHEAVKGGKGKEAFETAQEKGPSVFAAAAGERKHEAPEKRILKFPFDLNELPSDEDEDIMP